MSERIMPNALKVLTILAITTLVAVEVGGINPSFDSNLIGGSLAPMAFAGEEGIIKDVDDVVHFKATIKNVGIVETTYIILVKWRPDGTEEWEAGGLEDIRLAPSQSETILVGEICCAEWMMGKYFDVKFLLYKHDSEQLLDEKEIDKAWYVEETLIAGTISSYMIF